MRDRNSYLSASLAIKTSRFDVLVTASHISCSYAVIFILNIDRVASWQLSPAIRMLDCGQLKHLISSLNDFPNLKFTNKKCRPYQTTTSNQSSKLNQMILYSNFPLESISISKKKTKEANSIPIILIKSFCTETEPGLPYKQESRKVQLAIKCIYSCKYHSFYIGWFLSSKCKLNITRIIENALDPFSWLQMLGRLNSYQSSVVTGLPNMYPLKPIDQILPILCIPILGKACFWGIILMDYRTKFRLAEIQVTLLLNI